MMELQIALIVSAIFQVIAFIISISLIPQTNFKIAWISISVGFFLMAIRRVIELLYVWYGISPGLSDISANSWIAVIISLAMLIASVYIRKIFQVINRIHLLRKENEAKLLSSVIQTEEKERKYFSKELHDGLGPVLSSIKMTLSAIDKTQVSELNQQLIAKTEHLINHGIEVTKEISNKLTPHVLENFGLKKAIDNFIRNLPENITVNIQITADIEKKRYSYETEVILYRIFCELINNTLKYAQATRISVLIAENNEMLNFIYDDNGVGFTMDDIDQKGMGINNIKSRVASLNGSLEIISSPNKGFYANIKLPK